MCDKPDDIIGHRTFMNPDGLTFRHEPLTRADADALRKQVEKEREKRAADMPTEKDAANELWRAHYRLEELGWKNPDYAHELKQDGMEALLIELGSAGIHRGYYHAVNDHDVWWCGPEGSPVHPALIKAIPKGKP